MYDTIPVKIRALIYLCFLNTYLNVQIKIEVVENFLVTFFQLNTKT